MILIPDRKTRFYSSVLPQPQVRLSYHRDSMDPGIVKALTIRAEEAEYCGNYAAAKNFYVEVGRSEIV